MMGGIEVSPDDKQGKVIWTHGLGGCLGAIVFSEDEHGHKSAVLTHFDPTNASANVRVLRRLIGSLPTMRTSKHKQSVLVLAAEGCELSQQTKQYEQVLESQSHVDLLIGAIHDELGQDVEVRVEPYSTAISLEGMDQGSLVVRIPPKGQATYQTWFSQGVLGKPKE